MRILLLVISTLVAYMPLNSDAAEQSIELDVYKTATCGCCKRWLKHLDESEIVHQATDIEHSLLQDMKEEKGIKPRMRSCHTAIYKDKYVFEGHVPAKYIEQFIANPPEGAIGLSTPGMPVGSPGMEAGDHFQPYSVMQLNADGTSVVYVEIKSYRQQF